MKKSAIAIATILALTGAAFAENPNGVTPQQPQKPAVSLDLNSTGSVQDTSKDGAKQPRLGYEGSPWFITNVN